MNTDIQKLFFQLVRLGIGYTEITDNIDCVDWNQLKTLAESQGLSAVVLDGLDTLNTINSNSTNPLPLQLKLEWIGEVLQGEQIYKLQHEVANDMGNLFHKNAIRTYVLKGDVIAECYPKPNHRVSVDVDCYLLPDNGEFDAWSLGNDLIRAKHFDVKTDFYKNSTFDISGVVVENHQYLVPFRGNKRLEKLEFLFQEQFKSLRFQGFNELENSRIGDTWLYRPPVMVSALFLIEHAYSHFLHEGLMWRHVLDWMLFSKNYHNKIDWNTFDQWINDSGFRLFYDSFRSIGRYLMGIIEDKELSIKDRKMLDDIWAPLDVHQTVRGVKGKLALVGNTWRARWKYDYFTEMTWIEALWIQVKGFLFEKEPVLK